MTPQETLSVIEALARAYPQWGAKAATKEAVATWAMVLRDDDYIAVQAAAVAHIRESEFPPTIAGLLRRIPGGDVEEVAARAWAEVVEAYSSTSFVTPAGCGSQPPPEPEWSHPKTRDTLVGLGGWNDWYWKRSKGEGHGPSERKAFIEVFVSEHRAEDRKALAEPRQDGGSIEPMQDIIAQLLGGDATLDSQTSGSENNEDRDTDENPSSGPRRKHVNSERASADGD